MEPALAFPRRTIWPGRAGVYPRQVPPQYSSLNHEQQFNVADLEKSFAEANHAPLEAFRVSCHAGELVSLEVCVDKNLQYRSCTQSVRECPVNQVDMRPPQ